MAIHRQKGQNEILKRIFFRLLPVQMAIIAMGSINTIVDGVIAARFIDAATVGVIGLYYTMLRVLEASGSVLIGGVTVLSGKHLGSGRIDQTRGTISLGISLALIIGAILSAVSLLAPGSIADLLGADQNLKGVLSAYVRGYAIGIIPQLLGQQFASALQMERKEWLGHAAVAVMVVSNVTLDIVFVVVWNLGIWGIALATSLANWAYFLVVACYFLTKKAQMRPSLKLIVWKESSSIIKIGFPNALLVICLAVRSLVLNRLLLTYSGSDGLSALSSFNMVLGLIVAMAIGAGSLVRMLSSVFLGEDNRESLLAVIRIASTYVMAGMVGVAILTVTFSSFLTGLFFQDPASVVYGLTRQLFIIYGCGLPIALACIIISNYFQAAGHLLFVNIISVVDGFFSSVIPALILAPRMGALGVWLAFLIGLCITLICSMLYPILRLRKIPRSLDEWLLLPADFGTSEHLVLNLHNAADVTQTAETVQTFCNQHGLSRKAGIHAGLCLEEIAGNIVRYGFRADRRRHDIEVRVVLKEQDVTLRIKDDCVPFNPQKWHEMTSAGTDPTKNVGIRLVYGIAGEVEYRSMLGMNVLTIVVAARNLKESRNRTAGAAGTSG